MYIAVSVFCNPNVIPVASPVVMASESDSRSVAESTASTEVLPGNLDGQVSMHCGNYKCCTCFDVTNRSDCVVVRQASKKQPEEVIRCKACHNLKSRINRLMKNNGNLAQDWTEMSESQRSDFVKANKGLFGAELELKVSETVMIAKSKKSTISFSGHGHFLTEIALRKKYVDEPHIADSIIKNSRNFWDAIKGVYQYEDVDYENVTKDEETREETNRFRMDAGPNAILGDEEKPKAKPESKETRRRESNKRKNDTTDGENKPVKVTKTDINFAKKYVSALAPQKVELVSLKEKTAGHEHLYPAHVLTYAQQTLSKIEEMYGKIEPIFKGETPLESVNPDKKKLEDEVKAVVSEGSMAIQRLRVQVGEVSQWKK